VDEVQSRYLEAFLLNCDAKFPPAAIGNIYLWKKVRPRQVPFFDPPSIHPPPTTTHPLSSPTTNPPTTP
jgi:hypothetical protein